MTKKALDVHKKLLKKMGKQMLSVMRKEYKTDRKLREFLVESLVENHVEVYADDWYDFLCDTVRDGWYKGKGFGKMTINELSEEYVDWILCSYLNKKNYEMLFEEVKNKFENGNVDSEADEEDYYENEDED